MKTVNWEALIDKAGADAGFKQRLLADPSKTLGEEGVAVPDGVTVKVVESTDKEVWLVLPHKHSSIKFLSPYVAVCEDPEVPAGDSKSCQNPAAGCAI